MVRSDCKCHTLQSGTCGAASQQTITCNLLSLVLVDLFEQPYQNVMLRCRLHVLATYPTYHITYRSLDFWFVVVVEGEDTHVNSSGQEESSFSDVCVMVLIHHSHTQSTRAFQWLQSAQDNHTLTTSVCVTSTDPRIPRALL